MGGDAIVAEEEALGEVDVDRREEGRRSTDLENFAYSGSRWSTVTGAGFTQAGNFCTHRDPP